MGSSAAPIIAAVANPMAGLTAIAGRTLLKPPKIDTAAQSYAAPPEKAVPASANAGLGMLGSQIAAASSGGTIFGDAKDNRRQIGNDPNAPRKSLLGS